MSAERLYQHYQNGSMTKWELFARLRDTGLDPPEQLAEEYRQWCEEHRSGSATLRMGSFIERGGGEKLH